MSSSCQNDVGGCYLRVWLDKAINKKKDNSLAGTH